MRIVLCILIFSFYSYAASSDLYRLKGQGNFYRDFETMNVKRWLSKKQWLKSLKYSEYEKRNEIERNYREEIGRVITCIGACRLHRDKGWYDLSYRSLILEGDTLETAKDSYLWVALKNGNMVRLSALTKLQFPEVNISPQKIHMTMVLVHGFFHHLDRADDPTLKDHSVRYHFDTDTIVFPLRYKFANMEYYYWRKMIKKNLKEPTRNQLFTQYLSAKAQADQLTTGKFKREYFIHTPYGDVITENSSFMMRFEPDVGTYWWHGLNKGSVEKASIQLRKAKAFEDTLSPRKWYVIKDGEAKLKPELEKEFIGERYLVERGIGVRFIRDHFFKKYFYQLYKNLYLKDRNKTAKFGARTWNEEEMTTRLEYTKKYYHFVGRRWSKHYAKLDAKWAKVPSSLYNSKALKDVVAHLTQMKTKNFPIMKEYNKTQFHFWLWSRTTGAWYPKNAGKE